MKLTTKHLTKYFLVIKKKESEFGQTSEILYVSFDKSLLKQKIKEFKHQGGHHPSTEIDIKAFKSFFLTPSSDKVYGIFGDMGPDHYPILLECISNKKDFEQAKNILLSRGHKPQKFSLKQIPLVKLSSKVK